MNNQTWAFFGTSNFSVLVLDELKKRGFVPSFIVTVPDKPKGRKLVLTPPEVKVWAEKEKIPFIQPGSLKGEEVREKINSAAPQGFDFFVVASYGKIIPQSILDIPRLSTLNVHPSLLPKLRGASPLQNAILTENETGITIIRLDDQMDHGPIIFQKMILSWQDNDVPYEGDLENLLGQEGGKILADILPDWTSGKIEEREQDHSMATVCTKIEKEDGLIDLNDSPEKNLRKIRAFHKWPGAYFFVSHQGKNIRVKVKQAHIEDDKLVIDKVVPEGKKEMIYSDFQKGLK